MWSDGIGNWSIIMNFVSFLAIPINLSILLFARSPANEATGIDQDLDEIDLSEQSEMTKFFKNRDPSYWTRTNMILVAIATEHLIIGIKVVIQILIPDIPKDVKYAEANRRECED